MKNSSTGQSSSTIDVGSDRRDQLFAVLSDARRRFVLRTLQLADREMSVSELTSEVVSWEADMTDSGTTDDVRDTVEISLVHTHLPKMAQAGVVSYDPAAGTVALTDRRHELDHHLSAVAAPTTGDD